MCGTDHYIRFITSPWTYLVNPLCDSYRLRPDGAKQITKNLAKTITLKYVENNSIQSPPPFAKNTCKL